MALPGYQCQQCWAIFVDQGGGGRAEKRTLKCPTCHSENVEKVDLPEDWVFGGFGGLCLG